MLDSALETGLMFAGERALIEPDCADADLFPAGAVFISRRGETIGSVQSLQCVHLHDHAAAHLLPCIVSRHAAALDKPGRRSKVDITRMQLSRCMPVQPRRSFDPAVHMR